MRRLLTAAILVTLCCTPAFAADRHWTGRVSANWSNPANWDPEGVPSASESIDFPGWPVNRSIQFDLAAGSPVGTMSFLGDYVINGNLMTLTGDVGIVSSPEAVPVTFNNNLKIGNAVRFLGPFQLTVNGAIDVNGKTLRMGTTYATLLKGPLNGTGTLVIDPRGVSLLGGGNFSGTVQGNAWVAGSYPNATFVSPWFTGTGTAGAVTAKLVSPGEWQPWLYLEPHELGTLRTGPLSITGQYTVDVVPGGAADKVVVTGSVSLAGTLAVTIDGAAPVAEGSSYTIIANDGTDAVSGTFAGLPEGAPVTAGSTTFHISYHGGDGNDVVLNAVGAPTRVATSTSLAQNRATTEEGEPVTFSATVAAASGTPEGNVSFFDGSLNFGTVPLTNGSASLTVTHLTIGSHQITATYAGSSAFDGSSSVSITHTVVKRAAQVTITSSASTIVFGDRVSYTINVTAAAASWRTPTGTVSLTVDGATAGNDTVAADGTAHITVSSMPPGTHTVTATYSGDAFFNSASASLTQSVTAAVSHATTTSLAQNREPTEEHQPVTFTATVTSSNGVPSGTVSFFDGAQNLGTVPLENGSASLTVKTLAIGTHAITATYSGSSSYDASSSAPLTHNVVKGNPHVTISGPVSTVVYGDPAAFSINVAADAGTPTGSVVLTVDGTVAGNAALTNGATRITLPSLGAGAHAVAVTYSGDASFNRATASMTQSIAKAPTTVALRSQVNPSAVGLPVTLGIQVSPASRPAMPVAGSVVVANGGRTVTEAQLIGSAAAVRVGPLASGDYAISVTYGGDANFQSASATLMQHVARPAVVVQSAALEEGSAAHDALVRISLTDAAPTPVSVDYRTVDGTAKGGEDYLEAHGSLVFNPGQTSIAVPVRILGDTTVEPDETFRVELANVSGAAVSTEPIQLTIENDDLSYRAAAAYAFASSDGATLRATFYAPAASNGPWPVILWIPGNTAWDGIGGDVAALRETARGYAVLSVAYRPAATAAFPAQVNDLAAAVRWLRANALTLNVDPHRVVAWGVGAGGHLAALLGTGMNDTDSAARVDAVIDWGGISDLASLQADAFGCSTTDWTAAASPASQLLGCALDACPAAADAAAPARYATKSAAPLLLMHGSADCFVAPRQSERLADALARAGADVTLRVVDFVGHDDPWWTSAAAFAEVDAFLDAKVKGGRGRARAVGH